MFTSALSGENIENAFMTLISEIINNREKVPRDSIMITKTNTANFAQNTSKNKLLK